MKTAHTTCVINAPIEQVWAIMTNIQNYPAWNPFVYKIEADSLAPKAGGKMTFSVQFEKGSKARSKEFVTVFTPPTAAEPTAYWTYRFDSFLHKIGMIRAIRTQELRVLPDGKTAYSTTEIFSGWGQAFVPIEQVQLGFETQAAALKKACEG